MMNFSNYAKKLFEEADDDTKLAADANGVPTDDVKKPLGEEDDPDTSVKDDDKDKDLDEEDDPDDKDDDKDKDDKDLDEEDDPDDKDDKDKDDKDLDEEDDPDAPIADDADGEMDEEDDLTGAKIGAPQDIDSSSLNADSQKRLSEALRWWDKKSLKEQRSLVYRVYKARRVKK